MTYREETIQGRLRNRLQTQPDGKTIKFSGDRSGDHWRTFADFYGAAGGTAGRLLDLGVQRGEVVVIVLPSGEPAARLVLATLIAGGRPLLVAPPGLLGPSSDLPMILGSSTRKTGARVVVLPEAVDTDSIVVGRRTRVVSDDAGLVAAPQVEGLPSFAVFPDDPAALQLTSGTTGLPRICSWRQSAIIAAVDGMTAAMEVNDQDVFLNWTPLYHDMGLVNNFLTCLLSDIPLVMMSPHKFVKSPASWLRALSETGATTTWSPNFGFALAAQRIKEAELVGVELSHVRGFWNAAERIHLDTMERFYERFAPFGVRRSSLKTNFGCAENIGGATFTEPGEPFRYEHVDPHQLQDRRLAKVVSPDSPGALAVVGAGKPHPGIKISILDRNGRPLPDGAVGQIALDTASQMDGYLKDAEATARALKDGLLRTGDLGYQRSGELFWVGRVKERITVRGRKFDPSDFEHLLFPIDGLRPGCFAAFGIDDRATGTQKVVVVSEVVAGLMRAPDEIVNEMRLATMESLGLTVDALLVPTGTLTKTSSGKRRHRHFKRLYERGELPTLDGGVIR
jgi:acyl-CoA synthetase (AMP-forming)/AMP-acid ligase II